MSSEGEEWQIVKTVGSEEEATVIVGFLRANDIPAEVDSLHISELPLDIGEMSDVRVRVPPDRAEDARQLLAESDAGETRVDAARGVSPRRRRRARTPRTR
jgi:hypothetical protein